MRWDSKQTEMSEAWGSAVSDEVREVDFLGSLADHSKEPWSLLSYVQQEIAPMFKLGRGCSVTY